MIKFILLLTLCFSETLMGLPVQDHQIDRRALAELATALQIPPEADIVAETQKRWLRKAGLELWEVDELSSEERRFVLDWAEGQGMFSAWRPSLEHYDVAVILGATTPRMQLRLDYLKQLWMEGVRFDKVAWLTGDRPLDSRIDRFIDRCNLECEAARLIWEETDLPEAMRCLPALFFAAPMKKKGGVLKRPGREDTLAAWLQTEPAPCTALFVANQPFCGQQFAVIKACLPKTFVFDFVGPGMDPAEYPAAAAVTLDSLARWIYQEHLAAETDEQSR